jgi:hypothetical protein
MSHLPGDPPGASPTETMYWLEDVLVSLVLVIDGEALTKAVTWGITQGRTSVQIVVMSLFEVALAEELSLSRKQPLVNVSKAVNISPICVKYCMSTHPRERPELQAGMKAERRHGELIMESNCMGTV